MKRTKLIFAVLAAIVGIGGAYASQPKEQKSAVVARWHTVNGTVTITGSTAFAQQSCKIGSLKKCLIGTINGQIYKTLLGTFQ
jgi:UDP-N-acetylmuramyl tripeptide synthase